jgi:hypothetical protein
VDLKAVTFPKFQQIITALTSNHISTAIHFDEFYEELCKCKDVLEEINNGNILGDVGQTWLPCF